MGPVSPRTRRVSLMTTKRLMLKDTQHRFRRACDQIVLLNRRMEGVLFRYHRARLDVCRGFRYKLRLRLAIVEGVRNMFYEYANRKAFEIVNLRRDMFGEIVEIVTDERRDDDVMLQSEESTGDSDESMYDTEDEEEEEGDGDNEDDAVEVLDLTNEVDEQQENGHTIDKEDELMPESQDMIQDGPEVMD